METKETIYIVGHKNPDSDSICSALALQSATEEIYSNHRDIENDIPFQ